MRVDDPVETADELSLQGFIRIQYLLPERVAIVRGKFDTLKLKQICSFSVYLNRDGSPYIRHAAGSYCVANSGP